MKWLLRKCILLYAKNKKEFLFSEAVKKSGNHELPTLFYCMKFHRENKKFHAFHLRYFERLLND